MTVVSEELLQLIDLTIQKLLEGQNIAPGTEIFLGKDPYVITNSLHFCLFYLLFDRSIRYDSNHTKGEGSLIIFLLLFHASLPSAQRSSYNNPAYWN